MQRMWTCLFYQVAYGQWRSAGLGMSRWLVSDQCSSVCVIFSSNITSLHVQQLRFATVVVNRHTETPAINSLYMIRSAELNAYLTAITVPRQHICREAITGSTPPGWPTLLRIDVYPSTTFIWHSWTRLVLLLHTLGTAQSLVAYAMKIYCFASSRIFLHSPAQISLA